MAYQSAAINVGLLQVNGQSGGTVGLGMTSVSGGGNGGGGSSNQFIGINGDWASSWINVGLIYSVSGAGAQPGPASDASVRQAGPESLPAVVQPRAWSAPPGGTAQSGTFRFRWDRQEASARSGERAKEGRHERAPSRRPG